MKYLSVTLVTLLLAACSSMGMHRSDMTSGASTSDDNMSTRAQSDRYQPGVYGPDYLYFGS